MTLLEVGLKKWADRPFFARHVQYYLFSLLNYVGMVIMPFVIRSNLNTRKSTGDSTVCVVIIMRADFP